MAKLKSVLIASALVAAGAATAVSLGSGNDDEATGTRNLTNQVWVERMPQSRRDMIGHFIMLDGSRDKFGAIGRSSTWRHAFEIFGWRLEGKRLSLFFPQEEARTRVDVRTWRCAGEAPEPFELCLEIKTGSGTINFYSHPDWVIESDGSVEAFADEHPELASVFEHAMPETTVELDVDDLDYSTAALPW